MSNNEPKKQDLAGHEALKFTELPLYGGRMPVRGTSTYKADMKALMEYQEQLAPELNKSMNETLKGK
jgi:hypothetical protein